MVPEPREFCFVWMFCARLLKFTPYLPRAENTADMEQRMALLSGNAKLAVDISGDGIFSDKPMWAAQVQFMESFECNKKNNLQERWRLLKSHMSLYFRDVGLLYDGNSSPPAS